VKPKILFLCTGNSCRSQMAEGFAGFLKADEMEAYSAGIESHELDPHAVLVMKELGIDITEQKSKHIDEFKDISIDYVITVCKHAHEHCPEFLDKGKVRYVPFDDPPRLAKNANNKEEALGHYRRVRDEIKDFILKLPGELEKE